MKELKILYLEDSNQDAEMTARTLKKAGIPFSFRLVDKQDEYEMALKQYQPDLVLADHSLFQFNSLEALRIFKSCDFKIPFILVTGTVSEEFAVNILKEGASDYLLKDNLARLPNAILNSLEKFRIDQERQQYLDHIVANEAMMKAAESLANFGSWEVDLLTGVNKWSDEAFRIYGYEPGEIEPSFEKILNHIHPDDVASLKANFEAILSRLDSFEHEFRIIDKNGKLKHISARILIRRNNELQPVGLIGFNQDITKRKEAEEKLLKTFKEMAMLEQEVAKQQLSQQKIITEVTIQAQEKERNELSKELHDNINQVLATVKMYLNLARDDESVREELVKRSYDNISYAIEEIRKLSKSLVAPSLGDIGIKEALEELAEEINCSKELQVELKYKNQGSIKVDPHIELMLYRIVQEQVNNTIKYAKANKAVVTLDIEEENIYLSIADDGVGFDPSKKAKGIGLKNIGSRVSFYAGRMDLISAPGKGCRLEINIPI
jgi:two-component system, NarL family, sensor histidine kinase UhpB